VKCHACGQDNADSALFCTACRRPMVAPTRLPARLEALAVPATGAASALAAPPAAAPARSRSANAPEAAERAEDDPNVLTDEQAWAAMVGDNNTAYYMTRFARQSGGGSGGWHWPGMLVTWYWMLYRKMWLPALVYFFVPGIVIGILNAMMPRAALPLTLAWWVALFVVPGLMANGWYYAHCRDKIRDVRARGGSRVQMLARLESAGGTSGVVAIVVAIFVLVAGIGILAAVALPAYQTYTLKAKVADAMALGADVAAAVGRQYEQNGTLPTDVDRLVAQAPHQSRFVSGVDVDSTTGTVTVRVDVNQRYLGSFKLVPSADNAHHLGWTCTTEDLARYVPASCRR